MRVVGVRGRGEDLLLHEVVSGDAVKVAGSLVSGVRLARCGMVCLHVYGMSNRIVAWSGAV